MADANDDVMNPGKARFAVRGGRWLSQEELEAHFAALIRLENVGVLLGAGASTGDLGGKTMKAVWESFSDVYPASFKWLQEQNFVGESGNANVETLLDSLEIALVEWERLQWSSKAEELKEARNNLYRATLAASLLKSEWWKLPHTVDSTCKELENHMSLLSRLTSSRQPGQPSPWIFTTNYDLAIEWAAESLGLRLTNGFEGLHNRAFSPHSFDLGLRNMLAKGEARFGTYGIYLAKIHGSLTWRLLADSSSYIEIPTSSVWPDLEEFLEGADKDFPIVYLSAAKYIQTVGFVLGELLRRFTEFLSRPQSCLMTIGYSFSDDHLNQIVTRALQNPTLQLVICLPEAQPTENQMDLAACSKWVRQIGGFESPQVTIVGGGEKAWLKSVVGYLPDPAIYDEQAQKIKELLRTVSAKPAPVLNTSGADTK